MEQSKGGFSAFCEKVKTWVRTAWEFIKKWAPIVWANICKYVKIAWEFISAKAKLLWAKGKAFTASKLSLDEIADSKAVTVCMISVLLNIILLLIVIF